MDEVATRWLMLVDAESESRRLIGEAQANGGEHSELRGALQNWWAAVKELLSFWVSERASGRLPGDLPMDLVNVWKGFAGDLAVGRIPDPIANTASEGRRAPGPSERRDIGLAVAYLIAATGGFEHAGVVVKINDPSPVKTIRECFGVARSTVQGWRKNAPPAPPDVGAVNEELLTDLMRSAGQRYQSVGRSQLAIRHRSTRN